MKYDEKEKNKKKRITAEHTWKVGDIGVNSWGYDQTNIDYYQVTKTTKSSIWIRPIGYASMEGNGCFEQYNVTPAKDHFIGSEIMKRVVFSEYNGKINEYVNMSYGILSHWGGKPNLKTCYA